MGGGEVRWLLQGLGALRFQAPKPSQYMIIMIHVAVLTTCGLTATFLTKPGVSSFDGGTDTLQSCRSCVGLMLWEMGDAP